MRVLRQAGCGSWLAKILTNYFMRLKHAPSSAEHIVFANEDLIELLREVADFLEKDEIVWHIIINAQRDSEGDFTAEIYRHQIVK